MSLPEGGCLIKVTVDRGEGLYNPNWVSSSNPYVKVKLDPSGREYRSDVATSGRNPQWNFMCTMEYQKELTLTFKVLDKDTFSKDDFIGEASMNILDVAKGWNGELQLYRTGGNKAGRITVNVEFYSKDSVKKDDEARLLAQQQAMAPQQAMLPQQVCYTPANYTPQAVMGQMMGQQQPAMGQMMGQQQPMMGQMMGQQQPMMGQMMGQQQPVMGQIMMGHQQPMMGQMMGQQQPVMGEMMGHHQPVMGSKFPPTFH